MHRVLLFLSLFPILAALVLRKLNADRVLRACRDTRLSKTGNQLARLMLDASGHRDATIRTSKRAWAGAAVTGENWLSLPAAHAEGASAADLGKAALRVGLYLLARRSPSAISRRRWALRFGHVFPIFTTIVCIFGLVVGKLPALWLLAIVAGSLALATCAQFLTVTANLQAATLAAVVLEKKHPLPCTADIEATITVTRAWAWHSILPGLLSRLA